eukprot:TRINITY_DN45033_c0_g1_i1.p1 TRINITY_DN45033_c0_g1~~TRINITY_DN45033_c0_g1_i1.p1  ORF type:complete len:409 (-),score=30.51 TRINITY_DN45033_c0_g1_i1:175-1401(-)
MTGVEGITKLKDGVLQAAGYGPSTYRLYEIWSTPRQPMEITYLVVWLHGGDMGEIESSNMQKMQRRLKCRSYFLVPQSPQKSAEGLRFDWGVSYTKSQNKDGLGYVFGQMHETYLKDLTSLVKQCARDVVASYTILIGYSMGGFGCFQLGAFSPGIFDAIVPVAGYGLGTFSRCQLLSGYQPRSSEILEDFIARYASQLAKVPVLIAIHSRIDQTSPFCDVEAIMAAVQKAAVGKSNGIAKLVVVPDGMADSDPRKTKRKLSGHHYLNYALLNESSDSVLYDQLRELLAQQPPRTMPTVENSLAKDLRTTPQFLLRSEVLPKPNPKPCPFRLPSPAPALVAQSDQWPYGKPRPKPCPSLLPSPARPPANISQKRPLQPDPYGGLATSKRPRPRGTLATVLVVESDKQD